MKYNNQYIGEKEILEGFAPVCWQNDLDDFRKEYLITLINNFTENKLILVNPEFDEFDVESDYEIFGGEVNFTCDTEELGEMLAAAFAEFSQMRCTMNNYENGIAYCDFESE